ncbi:magnesium-translocating P-type ATPase [Candidatus Phytoplasma oryzae]|uniref:Magnesium-transporting ATPase, P-type 1 n=1 Tax=Candidatus Phytoplasma oryzae TaxID=203274 RepID=A0A139JQN5_9MOLU|nr:magnesium-translocating P-type ATPase [Candidatus Phytoplasma oryzae]KXT29282.1 magnesium-translocating P-type ATPase [Candidatus Phytoplasma oryzae]RAM57682.1 magnesium transporter ATPase [Candidatus Phytoplasma oryzae]
MNKKNKDYFSFYKKISLQNIEETEKYFQTSLKTGLTLEKIKEKKLIYGFNILNQKKKNFFQKSIRILLNPFNILLFILIFVTFFKEVYLEKEKNYSTILIIIAILFISNIIYFIQEFKLSKISEKFKKIIQTNVSVKRNGLTYKVNSEEIIVGDIIFLSAGDIIPADIKLCETKDFFVKETSLTGENEPIEKYSFCKQNYINILEDRRIAFMGTNVISGYAKGIVISIGNKTYLGKINELANKNRNFNYQKDINSISKLLIISTLFIFPLIFIINWFKNPSDFDFLNIFLLSLTIILGMTPEMLPLITTLSFFHGVINLSKKNIIIKSLYSIQDLGTMNLLFTDKTGTLTENKIKINNYLNLNNCISKKVLKYSFLNSYFQTGFKSSIDISIIEEMKKKKYFLSWEYFKKKKIDEIPFDFKRRIVSVIISEHENTNITKVISKGAVEEILDICNYAEIIEPETNSKKLIKINKKKVLDKISYYNKKGMRVIGVAYKDIHKKYDPNIDKKLESDMIMIGFLTFFDIPKKSAIEVINSLKKLNIQVKILTGDNEILTKNIASQINIENHNDVLLGKDIDKMNDEYLYQKSLKINIFAKLTPENKARIVSIFKKKKNIIGFMGDGINDASAMKYANLAISVETGVDIAKEASDIIILDKDLKVIIDSILEGRRIYTNIMKYIKLTLSSNFSNIISIILASLYLPFVPFLHMQILFLNLIYDLICVFLPFDHVDSAYFKKPRKWHFKNVINFMFLFGFTALLFDLFFWIILYKFISHDSRFFQSSWFIFSFWTQIVNIFCLRTEKVFKNSKISFLLLLSILISIFSTFLIFSSSSILKYLNFINPFYNKKYIYLLILSIIFYILAISKVKSIFIKKYQELL